MDPTLIKIEPGFRRQHQQVEDTHNITEAIHREYEPEIQIIDHDIETMRTIEIEERPYG